MKKGLLALAIALMTLAPVSAPAAIRGFIGVGPGFYGGWYRPYWGGPYWGGYWGGYWGPYGYYNSGQIKLDTKARDAEVFINGSYAGTAHENKTMHLRPGSYNIEIRQGGHTLFANRVYVMRGKTLHLHPQI